MYYEKQASAHTRHSPEVTLESDSNPEGLFDYRAFECSQLFGRGSKSHLLNKGSSRLQSLGTGDCLGVPGI